MRDDGDFEFFGGANNRQTYVAAFGKDYVWFDLFEEFFGLMGALCQLEGNE